VPIKYREWKGKPSNPYVVLVSVKDQLWNDVLKHFALSKGVDPNLVKGWTLVKMATQFQNFKKKLTRDFIKNNRTPNWVYVKIKDHWKSFVEYKKNENFAQKSAQAKNSASKKGECNHHLRRGGYVAAIPKWRKMEQDLIAKGSYQQSFTGPKDRSIDIMRMGQIEPELWYP
jgi:ribosomal protein L39E